MECLDRADNLFHVFTIRWTESENRSTLGHHLSRELSWVSMFLGDIISVVLSSTNYNKSPVVYKGLEIPFKIYVSTIAAVNKISILDRYLGLAPCLYAELVRFQCLLAECLDKTLVLTEEPLAKRTRSEIWNEIRESLLLDKLLRMTRSKNFAPTKFCM